MTNHKISTGILYRHSKLDPQVEQQESRNKDDRCFTLSFSSEEPIERFFGIEVLDHKPESIKLDWLTSGRAPLLLDHDATKQIGVVEDAEISSDGKTRARVRFGKGELAESSYQDVLDGIKGNISVGYRYMSDGVTIESEGEKDKPNIYRITGWEPLEVSLVSIPADHTVGVGRADNVDNNEQQHPKQKQQQQTQQEQQIYEVRTNMKDTNITEKTVANENTAEALNPEQIRKDEGNRISEILAIGDLHNMSSQAREFMQQGKSIDSFRSFVLDKLAANEAINTSSPDDALIGMSQKESRSFSIIKAIRAVTSGNWQGAELEREASVAVSKQLGREPSSFFVPLDVTADITNGNGQRSIGQRSSMQVRNLEKLSNIAGGYLVGTDHMASSFIEMLRNKMLVKQMGARVMSGLHGDVAIPKQTGGASTFWVSEGQAPEASEQKFGQVTLSPRSVAAYTDFTRKLVLQSSPDIENLVREDLATILALELDRVAINGKVKKDAEPPGILATPGIGEVTIVVDDDADDNALKWGKIVDLESKIAAKNADIGSLGYLCDANMRGILKSKEKANNTAQFIWESSREDGFGMLNGYRVGTTNQMPANTIIFGNFADLIIGQWGVMDVLVDPYTLGTSGGLRIRVMQDVDLAIRHAESFAVANTV